MAIAGLDVGAAAEDRRGSPRCALGAAGHLKEMAKAQKGAGDLNVRVDWSEARAEPVQAVNVFAAQASREFHVLNLGFVAPPVMVDEVDARRVKQLKSISPHIVARILLAPQQMTELIDILSRNIASREKLLKSEREQ